MPSEIVTKFRVRYAETDRMGYAYYGNYAAWFEVGRVELLRKSGMSYREMEDHGIILPVRDMHVRYHKPAKYDEVVELHTTLKNLRGPRIVFDYLLTNETGEKLCTAEITLVFLDVESGKPVSAPRAVHEAFSD